MIRPITCWLLLIAAPAHAIDGEVTHVVDADTIIVEDTRVRIWGIDAPETDTPEGREAREWAQAEWTGKTVNCHEIATDRYGRTVAKCFEGRWDIAWDAIRAGHAVDWPEYSGGHYQ